MSHPTPRQQQLAQITVLRTRAVQLMSLANHRTMQVQVRMALRDLDEALIWLNAQDVVHRPLLLKIADRAAEFAALRLALIEKALADYGPDVTEIG